MLDELTCPSLEALAEALESGRLSPPYTESSLRQFLAQDQRQSVSEWLTSSGLSCQHAALLLRAVAVERRRHQTIADRIQLVWSGLDPSQAETRDTSVVVQDLFRSARSSVLIATYAVDSGMKARHLFGPLASRMEAEPDLKVTLFINIPPHEGQSPASTLRAFAHHFRQSVWPGTRLPDLHYDPRSLQSGATRSCLHAKCIVVDRERLFITSANFTEAAHARNLEAGLLVSDAAIAVALVTQFHRLNLPILEWTKE